MARELSQIQKPADFCPGKPDFNKIKDILLENDTKPPLSKLRDILALFPSGSVGYRMVIRASI